MQRKLGWIMLFTGAVLLCGGLMNWSLVTVIPDTTPPEWMIASDGRVAIYPCDGETYDKVSAVIVGVEDPESGVNSVIAVVDGASYSLTQSRLVWKVTFEPLSGGEHTVELTATNNNGLTNTYVATFWVYSSLQGKWYINTIEITSPDQEIRLTTLTLTFQFVKTVGVADSKVSCVVDWAGPEAGTIKLTNTATSTWTGTKTLTQGGTYTVTLTADDGVSEITMSIFDLGVGPQPIEWPRLNPMSILGLACMFIGTIMIATSKR